MLKDDNDKAAKLAALTMIDFGRNAKALGTEGFEDIVSITVMMSTVISVAVEGLKLKSTGELIDKKGCEDIIESVIVDFRSMMDVNLELMIKYGNIRA